MSVFWLELRNLRKGAIISTACIAAAIFGMLAFFPSMQSDSMQALANAKLEGVDPGLLAAMGLSKMPDFTQITAFFGYVLQFVVLSAMFILTQQAVGLLQKEEGEGTIEYLFSKPISRDELLAGKLAAHVAVWVLMLLAWAGTTVAGYLMFSNFTFAEALKESGIFYGAMFFVGLIFTAVGLLFSTLLRSNMRSGGVTLGLVLGTYMLGIVSAVVDSLDFLVWLSPMDWIKADKLMDTGILPAEWVVGIGVMIAAALAAWLFYRKKDLLI